ncbi:MAG: acyltransferase [Acidobacteriota bacterium]|nr:MAG: acyltransferase [Acidobacteriota bacterium]
MAFFRIGVFQFAPAFGEVDKNLARVEKAVEASERADLVVLPELFATGYQFVSHAEVGKLAEPVPGGPTTQFLLRLAKERCCVVVGGLAEKDGEAVYNAAVSVGSNGVLALYRKIHLFAEETVWFRPGDRPLPVFEARGTRVGIMVCFDWRFPEAARTLTLRGTDILAHPANLVHPHCPDAMVTRSLENRVFSATANRTGAEERGGKEKISFTGRSQVVSPEGERLIAMDAEEENFRVVEIDPALARDKHVTPQNDILRDRRPEFYER